MWVWALIQLSRSIRDRFLSNHKHTQILSLALYSIYFIHTQDPKNFKTHVYKNRVQVMAQTSTPSLASSLLNVEAIKVPYSTLLPSVMTGDSQHSLSVCILYTHFTRSNSTLFKVYIILFRFHFLDIHWSNNFFLKKIIDDSNSFHQFNLTPKIYLISLVIFFPLRYIYIYIFFFE